MCVDEKTGIQALERRYADITMEPGQPMRPKDRAQVDVVVVVIVDLDVNDHDHVNDFTGPIGPSPARNLAVLLPGGTSGVWGTSRES